MLPVAIPEFLIHKIFSNYTQFRCCCYWGRFYFIFRIVVANLRAKLSVPRTMTGCVHGIDHENVFKMKTAVDRGCSAFQQSV